MTDYRSQVWSLLLDEECRTVVRHLEAHGLPFIMLKGQTIASWLYPDPRQRTYNDLDVLVPRAAEASAVAALGEIGYHPLLGDPNLRASSPEEQPLRNDRGVVIDLHVSLKGIRLGPDDAWRILDAESAPWEWSGITVRALAPHARAMHLALHLAQRGPVDEKAARDLELGLERLDHDVWRRARDLAVRLQALEAFTAGLFALPQGATVAERLQLTRPEHTETRMRAASASHSALSVERLASAGGWRLRIALLRAALFPSAEWMRLHKPHDASTPVRLLLARLRRPVLLLLKVPSAVRERRRYRRGAGPGSGQDHDLSGGASPG